MNSRRLPARPPSSRARGIGFLLLVLASCAPSVPNLGSAPNLSGLTKQAVRLGADCNQSARRFAAAPTDKARQEVLGKLGALNSVLGETAEYEREARLANAVDLIKANRAFLESGRAWGLCSLEYNEVLVAVGDRETARYNYEGLLARLTGPQFVPITRKVRAALEELRRSERADSPKGALRYSFGRGDP